MAPNVDLCQLRIRRRERRQIVLVPPIESLSDGRNPSLLFHRELTERDLSVDLVDDLLGKSLVASDLLPLSAALVVDDNPVKTVFLS
jgi:hypothetical protein